jgi:hypothetical protein
MTTDAQEVGALLEDAGQAEYHTLLEIWLKVLEPAEKLRTSRITPQEASRIVNSYPGMHLRDMDAFRRLFYEKVESFYRILRETVSEDDEALKRTTAEEDAKENRHLYLMVLFSWQHHILLWELEWMYDDPEAAAEMAAISEIHKMFFSDNGITSLLDQIGFEFDDADREALVEMLEETRKAMGD